MLDINDRISIQVGLSGYSFSIQTQGRVCVSGWKGADTMFSTPELHRRYSDVAISVFTPYCTLVPKNFFKPESAHTMLADVVKIPSGVSVDTISVPEYSAVMIYSDDVAGTLPKALSQSVLRADGSISAPRPELYFMLESLARIDDYNKIVASYAEGVLYLVIAQGKTLLLCNAYDAADFTTAEYYLFMALKKLQFNIEMSTVYFRTPLTEDQKTSLYRYFMNVEHIL